MSTDSLETTSSGVSLISVEQLQATDRSLSRIGSHTSAYVKSITRNVQDDNLQTEKTIEGAKKTDLGRILTRPDYADAMRVATHQGPLETELGECFPDDEKLLRSMAAEPSEKEAISEEVDELEQEATDKKYPPVDRGYAWVVCFAELLMSISTWGSGTSFGIYISYWLNNDTFVGADPLNYALSSSMVLLFAEALAFIAMMIEYMIGLKLTVALGAALHFSGLMLCSYSTKLWQLYCTQSVMMGCGFALLFNPAIVIMASWFVKYRALASGIVACGAGVGGAIFTLVGQALITRDNDYHNAMRVVGYITLGLNIIVLILIKDRIPKKRDRSWKGFKNQWKIITSTKPIRRWYVMLIALWFGFGIMSYIIMMLSLSSFATFIGLSQATGAHITAIFNGCQAIGRPIIGIIGDRFGRINSSIAINWFVVVIIFAFFINCTNFITLLFFSIVSGLSTGWCQVLNQAIMPDAMPLKEFPAAWTYENAIIGIWSLAAEVIALKLRQQGKPKPFLHAQIFAGCMAFIACCCITPVREWKIKRVLKSRLEFCQEKLKDSALSTEESQLNKERLQRYEYLLRDGSKAYCERLFYPIKV